MKDKDRNELGRVYWQSRRGMLELDLLLIPFAQEAYPGLDAEARAQFRSLLVCEDTQLYRWLVARDAEPAPEHASIIARIVEHGRVAGA